MHQGGEHGQRCQAKAQQEAFTKAGMVGQSVGEGVGIQVRQSQLGIARSKPKGILITMTPTWGQESSIGNRSRGWRSRNKNQESGVQAVTRSQRRNQEPKQETRAIAEARSSG